MEALAPFAENQHVNVGTSILHVFGHLRAVPLEHCRGVSLTNKPSRGDPGSAYGPVPDGDV